MTTQLPPIRSCPPSDALNCRPRVPGHLCLCFIPEDLSKAFPTPLPVYRDRSSLRASAAEWPKPTPLYYKQAPKAH